MVEISFPGMDKCSFTFSGLEKNDNTLAFFLDLLAKNNMLTNQRSTEGKCSPDGHTTDAFAAISRSRWIMTSTGTGYTFPLIRLKMPA